MLTNVPFAVMNAFYMLTLMNSSLTQLYKYCKYSINLCDKW